MPRKTKNEKLKEWIEEIMLEGNECDADSGMKILNEQKRLGVNGAEFRKYMQDLGCDHELEWAAEACAMAGLGGLHMIIASRGRE